MIKALQTDQQKSASSESPPLTVKSVGKALAEVTRWDDLGIQLGVSDGEVREIEEKHKGYVV